MSCACLFTLQQKVVNGVCGENTCLANQIAQVLSNAFIAFENNTAGCCGTTPWPSIPIVNNIALSFTIMNDTLASFTSLIKNDTAFTQSVASQFTSSSIVIVNTIVPTLGYDVSMTLPRILQYIEHILTENSEITFDSLVAVSRAQDKNNVKGGSIPLMGIIGIVGVVVVVIGWFAIKFIKQSTRKKQSMAIALPRIQLCVPGITIRRASTQFAPSTSERFETMNPMSSSPTRFDDDRDVVGMLDEDEQSDNDQITKRGTHIRHVHRDSLDPHYSERFEDSYKSLETQFNV